MWWWDFYDGTPYSLTTNPEHTYTMPGLYMVKLTVATAHDTASITKNIWVQQVNDVVMCPGGSDSIAVPSVAGNTYQWQTGMDFVSFNNVTDNANYSGSNTSKLKLINMPSSNYGRIYRCLVNGANTAERFRISFSNNWTGTAGSAWENPANWSCGGLPDGNTNVIINSGPVVISSNAVCRTLYVAPGASFTIAPGATLTITH
jgi:PKD domain